METSDVESWSFHKIAKELHSHKNMGDGIAAVDCPVEMLRTVSDEGSALKDVQTTPLVVRGLDVTNLKNIMKSLIASGLMSGSNLQVRERMVEVEPETWQRINSEYGTKYALKNGFARYLDVFDGNHRVTAFKKVKELAEEKAPEFEGIQLPPELAESFNDKSTFQCVVYGEGTPSQLCIQYARRLNEINMICAKNSFVNDLRYIFTVAFKTQIDGTLPPDQLGQKKQNERAYYNACKTKLVESLESNMTAALSSGHLTAEQREIVAGKFKKGGTALHKFTMVMILQGEGISFLEGVDNLPWGEVYGLLDEMIKGETMSMPKEMKEQAGFSFLGGTNTPAALQGKCALPQSALRELTAAVVRHKEVAPQWYINKFGTGMSKAPPNCKKHIDKLRARILALYLAHAAWKVFSWNSVGRVSSEAMIGATAGELLPKPENPGGIEGSKAAIDGDDGPFRQYMDDLDVVLALYKDEVAASENAPAPSSLHYPNLLTAKNPMYPLMVLLISMPLVRYAGMADPLFDSVQVRGLAAQVLDRWHTTFPELPSSVQERHFSSTPCAKTRQREEKEQKEAAELAARKKEEEAKAKQEQQDMELSKKTEIFRAQQLNQEQEVRERAVKLLQQEVERRENALPEERHNYLDFVVHATEPENTTMSQGGMDNNPGTALLVLDEMPPKHWPVASLTLKSMEATFKAGKNACFAVAVAHKDFSKGQELSDALRQSKGVVQDIPFVMGTTLGSLSLKHTSGGGTFTDSADDSWEGHAADGGGLDHIIVFPFFASQAALDRFNQNWASTFRSKGRVGQNGKEQAFLGDGRSFLDKNVPFSFFNHERTSVRFNLSAWTGGEMAGANVKKDFEFPRELAYGELLNSMGWGANNPSSTSSTTKPVWFLRGQTIGAYALFSAQDGGVPVVFGPLKALPQGTAPQPAPTAAGAAQIMSAQYRTMENLAWAFHTDNSTYFAHGYSRTTSVMLLRMIAAMCSAPGVESLRRRRYFLEAHTPTHKLRHGGTGSFAFKTGQDYVETSRQRLAATGVKGLPIKPLAAGRRRERGAFLMPAAKFNAADSEVFSRFCPFVLKTSV